MNEEVTQIEESEKRMIAPSQKQSFINELHLNALEVATLNACYVLIR